MDYQLNEQHNYRKLPMNLLLEIQQFKFKPAELLFKMKISDLNIFGLDMQIMDDLLDLINCYSSIEEHDTGYMEAQETLKYLNKRYYRMHMKIRKHVQSFKKSLKTVEHIVDRYLSNDSSDPKYKVWIGGMSLISDDVSQANTAFNRKYTPKE